jgi:hypothetical protein
MAYAQTREATVYKIYFDDHPGQLYIGSTCQSLKRRFQTHKSYCITGKDKLLYNFIRENGGWGIVKYEALHRELVSCQREQFACEQRFVDAYRPNLNIQRAYSSPEYVKERTRRYNEENKERIAKRNKEYAEANKEQIAQKKKEYDQVNKASIAEYQKQYSQDNKEKIKQYKKDYRRVNGARLSAEHADMYKNNAEFKARKKAIAKANYAKRKLIKVKCACGLTVNTKGRPLNLTSIRVFQRKNCHCTTYEEL